MRDLIHPEIVVKGVGVDHYERQTFAGNFVIDLDAVGGAVGHACLAAFKPFKPFKMFNPLRPR
jgi:hypothetical protein